MLRSIHAADLHAGMAVRVTGRPALEGTVYAVEARRHGYLVTLTLPDGRRAGFDSRRHLFLRDDGTTIWCPTCRARLPLADEALEEVYEYAGRRTLFVQTPECGHVQEFDRGLAPWPIDRTTGLPRF